MIIYYLSECSSIKCPINIQNDGKVIMRVGDICILSNKNGTKAVIINDVRDKWSNCALVALSKIKLKEDPGSLLLYSYDGITSRKGDILFIRKFQEIFKKDSYFLDFLISAEKILSYQMDVFPSQVLLNIYSVPYRNVNSHNENLKKDIDNKKDVITEKNVNNMMVPLGSFLPSNIENELLNYISLGKTLFESYGIIKNKYPKDFTRACILFAEKYPDTSIY